MAMDITPGGPVGGNPVTPAGKLPSRASIRSITSSEETPESRGSIVTIHPALGRFASADERMNAVAASARTAEKQAAKVSEAIDQMQETLSNVTKSYPPFPPGSEERVRMLKRYSALRKQIAQLTIPPDGETGRSRRAGQTEASPSYTFVLQADGRVRTVPREKLHIGPSGIIIPEIQENATDNDLRRAISTLERSARSLEEQRARAASELTAGAASELAARKGEVVMQSSPEAFRHIPLDEPAALAIGLSLREDLGTVQGRILHTPELQDALAGAETWHSS